VHFDGHVSQLGTFGTLAMGIRRNILEAFVRERISMKVPHTVRVNLRGALQKGVLPLFLEASESKNANVIPLVKAFFTGVPPARRKDMSGPQVFAGMNYMMRDVLPAAYAQLGKTTIRVTKVEVGADDTAVVEYVVKLPDGEATDTEHANLHQGRWYLRTKDSPAVTVERFRMLLGLDFESGPDVKLSPPATE